MNVAAIDIVTKRAATSPAVAMTRSALAAVQNFFGILIGYDSEILTKPNCSIGSLQFCSEAVTPMNFSLKNIGYITFLFLSLSTSITTAASFPCKKAKTADEIAICADPYLSQLDIKIAEIYSLSIVSLGKEAAASIARPLLNERKTCGASLACIAQVQEKTIDALRSALAIQEEPVSSADAQLPAEGPVPVSAARDQMPLAELWLATSQKPFDFVMSCYGLTLEELKARLQSSFKPDTFEAVFLNNGGHVQLSQLAFKVCDEAISAQGFFDDISTYSDAKTAFNKSTALMDFRLLSNCTTDVCKQIAERSLKPEWKR